MKTYNECPIILGGAQLGMPYGITNAKGKISSIDSKKIINYAVKQGIKYIDTAAAYGDSEEIIGIALSSKSYKTIKVITKLLPFDDKKEDLRNSSTCKKLVRSSIYSSSKKLDIDTILLHRAEHLNNNFIIDEMLKMRDEKFFNKIGVSIQHPNELDYLNDNQFISTIQIPFNLLDHRWEDSINFIKKLKKKRLLTVHVRGIFLQGLLLSQNEALWKKANVKNFTEIINWQFKILKDFKLNHMRDLCFNFVNSMDWVDNIVIGIDNFIQLKENFLLLKNKPLDNIKIDKIKKTRPQLKTSSLDPSQWK